MVQKILEKVPDEVLQQDLEKYQRRALELGATDAKIITTDMIVIDERVRLKCSVPPCPRRGDNAFCPPFALDLDLMRKVVNNFRYGIFTKIEVPPEELSGHQALVEKRHRRSARQNHEMVSKIESDAFYDGYYLAVAFANGSCKTPFCPDIECSALTTGQPCRHPLRARPAMEGVGMDAYGLAAKVGWDIYPIGGSSSPEDVPYGVALGLILIY